MTFKFERLEVWQRALAYSDVMEDLVAGLPERERFNLTSQTRRAATSIALNIAEGSTGQTDAEQAHFLGLALRSLIETVACLRLMQRRGYVTEQHAARADEQAVLLARKLSAFRRSLRPDRPWVREDDVLYDHHAERSARPDPPPGDEHPNQQ